MADLLYKTKITQCFTPYMQTDRQVLLQHPALLLSDWPRM